MPDDQTVTCRLAFLLDGAALVVAFADQDLGYSFETRPRRARAAAARARPRVETRAVPTFDGTLEDLRRFSDALANRYRIDL
jgi:hypothetical protein